MADQAERLRELSRGSFSPHPSVIKNAVMNKAENPAHVIAVTSGKGGVGKSTFTINLALALANYGKKVLIIDADLGMGNIDVMLGCLSSHSMVDIINGVKSFEEVVVTGPNNIKFLPGGSGMRYLVSLDSFDLQRVIGQAAQYETNTDFILLDTGAGLSSNVMNFIMSADDVLLVTTPEPTSMTDAYAIVKAYAANMGTAPLRLVVNRAGDSKESDMVADRLCKVTNRFLNMNIEPLGYILEDSSVMASIRTQNPLLLRNPDSLAANCILNIAHKLVFGSDRVEKTGFSGFFKKFLNISR